MNPTSFIKILFYFLIPYFCGWVFLWLSLPVVRLYRNLLLKWPKGQIERSPRIGAEDPEGDRVFKWHVFTIKYVLVKEPGKGETVRYLSIKERLSSPESALHDLDNFFSASVDSLQRFFLELRS